MIKRAEKEFIFHKNEKAPSCHASTVLHLDNGHVLAAWFGGAREGDNSVEIWISERDKNNNWSVPRSISEGDKIAHWNPVLYQRENGDIILYYKHRPQATLLRAYYRAEVRIIYISSFYIVHGCILSWQRQ